MNNQVTGFGQSTPWNKGKLIGQKAPLRISEIWAIRVRLEIFGRARDLALFNLAIDSKLRGCDLVQLRVNDVCHGGHVAARASVMQQKTKQPVQFELTAGTRKSLADWIAAAALRHGDFLFPSRITESPHISTRQYARIVHQWFDEIGLDPTAYSTHDAPDEGNTHLPAHKKFACGAAVAGPYATREHRTISGHRSR
jgi:integrase